MDKHTYFIKHNLFYNNIKESIHPDFLPFKDNFDNLQYLYQKNMSVDIHLAKIAFINKYPELNNIHDWWKKLHNIKYKKNNYKIDKKLFKDQFDDNTYKSLMSAFSQIKIFNSHIWKATEAYR